MRQILGLLVFIMTLTTTSAQEIRGTWLVDHGGFADNISPKIIGSSRMMIDFDTKLISDFDTKEAYPILIKSKKGRIKAKGKKGKLMYMKTTHNTILVQGPSNTKYNLKKLEFLHGIDWSKEDIEDFIIEQQCNTTNGLALKFMNQPYSPVGGSNFNRDYFSLSNKSTGRTGYWFVRKIEGNAFIVIMLGDNEPESIFQITSITLNGLKLQPVLEYKQLKDLKLITTCL